MPPIRVGAVAAAIALAASLLSASQALVIDPDLLSSFSWRPLGPYRAGRTTAAVGLPTQPNSFLIGTANGGIWKTTDAGRTWQPIFDTQPDGSIGALAVAPSDPNIVYAGTGEAAHRPDLSTGGGVYKSIDGGRTWSPAGLADSQQIAEIAIDPRDPARVFVAVPGHPYGPNPERGIFRSTDGARTFERVLYGNDNTGASGVALDPSNPRTVYAALWESRQAPWGAETFTGPGTGLFKTTDGGTTWRALTAGLPDHADDGLRRITLAIAPSRPARLFAVVDAARRAGLYRSDDGGESWTMAAGSARLIAAGSALTAVTVDPRNPEQVFVGGRGVWKSADAGASFSLWRAAQPGEIVRRIWINPLSPDAAVIAGDRGAAVTVNGGATWSSSFNQPTTQFDRVVTDTAFPYRVCGYGADAEALCVASRGDTGRVTVRDWSTAGPVAGDLAPDPGDVELIYGFADRVLRFDRRTGQAQDVDPPRSSGFRTLTIAPLLFSPVENRTLFFAGSSLWKTTTAGQAWSEISPDLSRETWSVPASTGAYAADAAARLGRHGVIRTVAPSYVDPTTIWAGTDDGLIHVTRDGGKSWTDVTPPGGAAWAAISRLEASHFDGNGAYAAIDAGRLDDRRPRLYRTRDGGRTWSDIARGLPATGVVRAIREDLVRRGTLFAGTDHAVFLSLDDGDTWQPLRLNMPATSIRDIAVKDADVIVATYGRGFWILDDIMPIRQITPDVARSPAYLFRPPTGYRVRTMAVTPWPADEPGAPNPPPGVWFTYLIGRGHTGPISIEVIETATGEVIRRLSSDDGAPRLATTPGLHRVSWDLRYGSSGSSGSPGIWVLPGTYQVRLTAGGQTYRQAVVVRLDPRVRTTAADLTLQHNLSKSLVTLMKRLDVERAEAERSMAAAESGSRPALESHLAALRGAAAPLPALLEAIQSIDAKPTITIEAAAKAAIAKAEAVLLGGSGD
jgi:photosystem II stability/assembly factor-like uncharacterized protein